MIRLIYKTVKALAVVAFGFIALFILAGCMSQTGCTKRDKEAMKSNQINMHETFTKGSGAALRNYRGPARRLKAVPVQSY